MSVENSSTLFSASADRVKLVSYASLNLFRVRVLQTLTSSLPSSLLLTHIGENSEDRSFSFNPPQHLNGIVNIFSKHSTSAICVNENEEGLLEDLEFVLSNIISNKFSYKHDNIDNNAESHLKSFLLSSSESVPISNNKLNLGTWQSVFFIELDGPRHNRIINITVIGE